MVVYVAATLISCLLGWQATRTDRYRILWCIAAALPLALVSALRWGVGTDMFYLYLPQFRAVEWMSGGGGADLARECFQPLIDGGVIHRSMSALFGDPMALAEVYWHGFSLEEPGYRALVWTIVRCGGSFHWFTVLTSFATAALVFAAIWRQSKAPVLAIYFYVATSNYFLSLNIVRQYLAVALVLLAVTFAVDRRFWRFALCVAVAALFHRSAVLALSVWFLPKLRMRPIAGFALVGLGCLASLYAAPFLRTVLPQIGLGIYVKYFDAGFSKDGFEWMFFAINVAFMVMGTWYYARAGSRNRCFAVWYWMTVLGTVALTFSGTVPLMKRVNYYFAAPQFLMLPEMLMAEGNRRLRRWLVVLAVLAFAAETAVAVALMNKNEPLPYRILPGGSF